MKSFSVLLAAAVFASATASAIVVDVTKAGRAKQEVAVNVANAAFAKSLKRNLELSGLFVVKPSAAIVVSGTPGADVKAEGAGKSVTAPHAVTDDASARMAARKLADAMCEAYGNQRGFAQDPVVFLSRTNQKGPSGNLISEICTCYPDGYDIRQLTQDREAVLGPRWKDGNTILFTKFKSGPQIWSLDIAGRTRKLLWSLKGFSSGATVSPDGRRVAIILPFQGNPELCVIDIGAGVVTRLTRTPNGNEGQPAWSPDGREIVYVSDETRSQQLWVIDVATKAKRRLTSRGKANVDPDWGRDGRIVYASAGVIRMLEPAKGDKEAKDVTTTGGWSHPSWARDGRHVVAGSGNSLFVLDTAEDGDDARPLFSAKGNWCDPSWKK